MVIRGHMRFKIISVLFAVACFPLLFSEVQARTYPVEAKFEVDGKESKQRFRVVLYADGAPVEPTVTDDGQFYVPTLSVEKVDVRFISGKYDLLYEDVYLKKLRGNLVFGVEENVSAEDAGCEPGKKLLAAYSLEFHPEDAEGTAMIVKVCQ